MESSGRQTRPGKAALVFFGTMLCVLLAIFAVERRVAAYPDHNIAAATTAATGLQKPDQMVFPDPQILDGPAILLCLLAMCVADTTPRAGYRIDANPHTSFMSWAPTPLAVRPPPAV
jgi:hypothetical protein